MLRIWLLCFSIGTALLLAPASLFLLQGRGTTAVRAQSAAEPLERLDILQTLQAASRPKVGALAPDFEVKDEIGAPFRLSSHYDKPILLGAFCNCSTCRETAKAWAQLVREAGPKAHVAALVALQRGDAIFQFHDDLRLNFPTIPDPDHALSVQFPGPGEGYAALGCPRAWVIGPNGRYRYVMPVGSHPTPQVMHAIRRALGLE